MRAGSLSLHQLLASSAFAVIPLLMAAATVKHGGMGDKAMLIVIGRASQIVGHSFFEERRPAPLDNPRHSS